MWATQAIEDLTAGKTVQIRPSGHSMSPRIKSRQLCTIEPVSVRPVEVDDAVLCRVKGRVYLHRVHATVRYKGEMSYQIGNNKGTHFNGWTKTIYGVVTKVED